MSYTIQNVQILIEDIKRSWYMRIWLVCAAILALVGFIGMINFAERSSQFGGEKDWNYWVRNESVISFPTFEIAIVDENLKWGDTSDHMKCFAPDNTPMTENTCIDGNRDRCSRFYGQNYKPAQQVQNFNPAVISKPDRIQCNFTLTPGSVTEDVNRMIKFEILAENYLEREYGHDNVALFIRDGQQAIVELSKREIILHHKKYIPEWRKKLSYRPIQQTDYFYTIDITMQTFLVRTYEQADNYNGWMSASDVGGFAYFLVIIHIMALIIVGFVLDNDAEFLKPGGSRPDDRFAPIGGEHDQIG